MPRGQPTPVMMKHLSAGRTAVAMMRMIGCNNGRYARNFLHSDCVIDEKTVVLQKKDNEGFGFVLRGAKGKSQPEPNCLCLPHHYRHHHNLHLHHFASLTPLAYVCSSVSSCLKFARFNSAFQFMHAPLPWLATVLWRRRKVAAPFDLVAFTLIALKAMMHCMTRLL